MKKIYKQLSIEEQEIIQQGIWDKKSIRLIASELDRSRTISRGFKRNTPPLRRVYLPRLAAERAKARIVSRGQRDRLKNNQIRDYVHLMLKNNYSPEQIAGRSVALER